jgi:hypothetical protein
VGGRDSPADGNGKIIRKISSRSTGYNKIVALRIKEGQAIIETAGKHLLAFLVGNGYNVNSMPATQAKEFKKPQEALFAHARANPKIANASDKYQSVYRDRIQDRRNP